MSNKPEGSAGVDGKKLKPLFGSRCFYIGFVIFLQSRYECDHFIYLSFSSCSNGNGIKMTGSLEHLDQPDPDTIKMFVGQIPRSWSETELKELFEPFGAVHQINILRDRTQNPPQSKGKVDIRKSNYRNCPNAS